MLRERSYPSAGNEVCIQELTNLVALYRPGTKQMASETSVEGEVDSFRFDLQEGPKGMQPSCQRPTELVSLVTESQVRAFENAGWVFLSRAEIGNYSNTIPQAQVF